MRTIKNQTTKIHEKTKALTFADLLRTCINNKPVGYSLADIRSRIRVLDILDALEEGEDIVLHEADFGVAQDAIREMRWAIIHADLVAFADAFEVKG